VNGRRLTAVVLVAAVPLASGAAQGSGPVFRFQPGMLSLDFVSTPPGVSSATAFNLRFETRFPTGARWITPVVGAAVTPYGTTAFGGRDQNAPVLFIGNVLPAVPASVTGGWATLELPILLYYQYGGGGNDNAHLYGRDAFVQLALSLHLGRKMLRDLGPFWSRLDAYAFIEQNLTPNEDSRAGRVDRFNPVALFGVTIPIAPAGPP
jgi:hypothetical protein